jgi:hypothetical protein
VDTVQQAVRETAALSGAAASAILDAMRRIDLSQVWLLLLGLYVAEAIVRLVRRRRDRKPGLGDVVFWILIGLFNVLIRLRDPAAHWPGYAMSLGAGVAFRIAGPPVARALRLPQIIAWLLAPVAFLIRKLGQGLALIFRPVASVWGRLPKPSAFQFAMGAVLCGCLVLTGLLAKTLFRL